MYKGRNKLNNKIVAIKILALDNALTSITDLWKEVTAMKMCNHPNVLRCYCCFCVQDRLWIVSPFMAKGSLLRVLRYLKKYENNGIDEGLDVGSWTCIPFRRILLLQLSNKQHMDCDIYTEPTFFIGTVSRIFH